MKVTDRHVSTGQAALCMGVSAEHVRRLIEDGSLLASDVGSGRKPRWNVAFRLDREPPADGRLLTVEEFMAARSSAAGM